MATDVFISYSSKKSQEAQRIETLLKQSGLRVWRDVNNIRQGDRYPAELEDALIASSALVLLLSPDAVQSTWVQREVELALEHGKKIFPIRISDHVMVGVFDKIKGIQYRDIAAQQQIKEDIELYLLELQCIYSGEGTKFISCKPSYDVEEGPRPAVPVENDHWPELSEPLDLSLRIAASKTPSDEEAEFGGRYIFQHDVKLAVHPDLVRRAELVIWSDDECQVHLNGRSIANWTFNVRDGEPSIRSEFLKLSHLTPELELVFTVRNWSWAQISGVGYPSGRNNPYGLAFALRILHVKPHLAISKSAERSSPSVIAKSEEASDLISKSRQKLPRIRWVGATKNTHFGVGWVYQLRNEGHSAFDLRVESMSEEAEFSISSDELHSNDEMELTLLVSKSDTEEAKRKRNGGVFHFLLHFTDENGLSFIQKSVIEYGSLKLGKATPQF